PRLLVRDPRRPRLPVAVARQPRALRPGSRRVRCPGGGAVARVPEVLHHQPLIGAGVYVDDFRVEHGAAVTDADGLRAFLRAAAVSIALVIDGTEDGAEPVSWEALPELLGAAWQSSTWYDPESLLGAFYADAYDLGRLDPPGHRFRLEHGEPVDPVAQLIDDFVWRATASPGAGEPATETAADQSDQFYQSDQPDQDAGDSDLTEKELAELGAVLDRLADDNVDGISNEDLEL